MLVTFQSENAADVLMFEKDARTMLKLMGRNDSIPGAMYPSEVGEALTKLRTALEAENADPEPPADAAGDDEEAEPVSTRSRAFPLLRLLESAERDEKHVMWDGKSEANHTAQADP